jgi:hypothetical protein
MDDAVTPVVANPDTLAALRPPAPLSIKVHLGRNADLAGQMRYHTAGHISAPLREASIELEGFRQHRTA